MSRLKVLIADDHPVMRLGVRRLLESDLDLVVVGEASDGEEALQMVKDLSPDVLLLDIEMPGLNGVEVVHRLEEAGSPVHVLVLSVHDDRYLVKELMENGIDGYLIKEDVPETIIEAVHGVARGEQGWISRKIAAQMSSYLQSNRRNPSYLTEREADILKSVIEGMTNVEIGMALNISEKTVEKHLEGIFYKLGVTSRVEAAVRALREGLEWHVKRRPQHVRSPS